MGQEITFSKKDVGTTRNLYAKECIWPYQKITTNGS